MNTPDFKTWAENLLILILEHGRARETLETALKQAYYQGEYRDDRKG